MKDIDGVKANADMIGGKVGERLRESFDVLDLSYQLVKLKFDVKLPFNILEDEPGENTTGADKALHRIWFLHVAQSNLMIGAHQKLRSQLRDKAKVETIDSKFSMDDYSKELILSEDDFAALMSKLSIK